NISQPAAPLQPTVLTLSDALCFGENSGALGVEATGGTGPYTYLWSNGLTADSIYNLSAGTYTVTVTDDRGCVATASGTVGQPSGALVAQVDIISPVRCFGGSEG